MLIFLQIFALLLVASSAYLAFTLIGPRQQGSVLDARQRAAWWNALSPSITKWLTRTNIIGTLTSLATAYLFFIGNTKFFGLWTLVCGVTLWLGAAVTTSITSALRAKTRWTPETADQSGGVISSIFKDVDDNGFSSRVAKIISIASAFGILWLEFALFADFSGLLSGMPSLPFRGLVLVVSAAVILGFTLRFGLRGFVSADIVLAPVIALSAITLGAGAIIALNVIGINAKTPGEFFAPIVDLKTCVLFLFHVLVANLFFVVTSEGHWIRMWVFGDQEQKQQKTSQAYVCVLWILLIAVGFFASDLAGGSAGEQATVTFLSKLWNLSALFPLAFFVGALAALFSTADASAYNLLLLLSYDTKKRKVESILGLNRPLVFAGGAAVVLGLVYIAVRATNIPIEKVVFMLMPLPLNILPGFVAVLRGGKYPGYLMLISAIFYLCASSIGLIRPMEQLQWNLGAALVPSFLAGLAAILPRPAGRTDH